MCRWMTSSFNNKSLLYLILIAIAVQKPFRTKFCLLLTWTMWKFSKWCFKSLCWTYRMPIHLKHIYQTLWACLHSTNRCWLDSSATWHIPQEVVLTSTPLLLKHNLVGILSNRILQAIVITLDMALTFHRHVNTLLCWPLVSKHIIRQFYWEQARVFTPSLQDILHLLVQRDPGYKWVQIRLHQWFPLKLLTPPPKAPLPN